MSQMAGCEAVSLAVKRRVYKGGETDREHAIELAARCRLEPEGIAAFVTRLAKQIRTKLAHPPHWAAVGALAEALVAKKQLSARVARRIIREAME